MITNKYLGMLIATFLALGAAAYGQSNRPKIGNTGYITLTQETMIGSTILPAGDYEVRHRRSANGHFVEITRMVDNTGEEGLSPSPSDWTVVAEVPCRMQSLRQPVARTYVEISKGTLAHVNSLRIRGEDVVHIFPAGPDPSASQNQIEYGGPGM